MSKWRTLTLNASSPARKVVSIAGIPGVGKSTAIESLSNLPLKIKVFPEQVKYFDQDDFELLDKIASENKLTSFEKQHMLQKIYIQAELRRWDDICSSTGSEDLVLLDRGVEETVFAMESLGRQGLLDINYFVANYYQLLAKSHSSVVIFLNASVAVARQRVKNRNAEEDRSDYYDLFYQDYESWYTTNVNPLSIIETNDMSLEQVVWKAREILQKI